MSSYFVLGNNSEKCYQSYGAFTVFSLQIKCAIHEFNYFFAECQLYMYFTRFCFSIRNASSLRSVIRALPPCAGGLLSMALTAEMTSHSKVAVDADLGCGTGSKAKGACKEYLHHGGGRGALG
ncbi:hypothetical protein PsorP6_002763 [Peronosclerospora sorghi]|uniref:Uncharacterized protein n=1 Tax=Peronosclerospora sorghi TaxID=230839 RepID=A0ACC0VQI2_9STRA|nr:hypothetical protein PsorP6_002763 [Peronosclerospora sorghi]